MGLLKKFFGGESASAGRSASSQFHESESTRTAGHVRQRAAARTGPRGAARHDAQARRPVGLAGMPHPDGGDPAPQDRHARAVHREAGRRRDRRPHPCIPGDLLARTRQVRVAAARLALQPGLAIRHGREPPGRRARRAGLGRQQANAERTDTQPPEEDEEVLRTDLQALYAIRDAALSRPAELAQLPPATAERTRPSRDARAPRRPSLNPGRPPSSCWP